jgi:hypothetical protein
LLCYMGQKEGHVLRDRADLRRFLNGVNWRLYKAIWLAAQ